MIRPEVIHLRKSVYDFYQNKIIPSCKPYMKVLEIGPMDQRFTPIKEYYISLKDIYASLNITYKTCDSFVDSQADFICDILDIEKHTTELFDIIIACEVIEHVGKIWQLPALFHRLLHPHGQVFITSPFHFYLHNPFPDCWRISEYGYHELFDQYFTLDIDKIFDNNDERKPLHHKIILTKRNEHV